MNKDTLFRIHPLIAAAIIVASLFVLLLGLYGLTRWMSSGEVMGRVEVAGTEVGGMTREEAHAALISLEEQHLSRQLVFTIDESEVELNPAETGLDIDVLSLLDQVMSVGREGNAPYQFLWWLTHIFATEELPLVGSTDPLAMEDIFDEWDATVIDEPASHGGVVVNNGVPQPVYPATGVGMARKESTTAIETQLLAEIPERVALPTKVIVPALTDADIDAAVSEATRLLSAPIRMVYDGAEVVFGVDQLTEAYRSMTIAESTPQVVHFFDPEVIDGYLAPIRADFESEPVDAVFSIDGDNISIIPGSRGTRIDEVETAQKLLQAGSTSGRVGQLPLVEDADPDVTTEELEALGIEHLVSSFTTHHSCCEDRVINIQTMADTVDMAIVMPGATFSLNEFVGERTPEKGYVPAGTILAGELVDTVGGGVSQFATTIYNAVFWGGYEDIHHKPHSYYFSRYPEGIEATVNWRAPDLVFRNNRASAILIDTRYTDTSITVRFFGSNGGRVVKGEQSGGETRIQVVAEGGPDAIHVEGTVSGRFAHTSPPPPRYIPNPSLAVDQVIEQQSERGGWSVNVTRRLLRGGGQLVEEREWLVTYLPAFGIYEVHPCKVPGQEQTCPSTTTIPTFPTTTPAPSP